MDTSIYNNKRYIYIIVLLYPYKRFYSSALLYAYEVAYKSTPPKNTEKTPETRMNTGFIAFSEGR